MIKKTKQKISYAFAALGLLGVTTTAFAMPNIIASGPLTPLQFAANNDLAETPFALPGVPTTSNGQDAFLGICVRGDFSFSAENPDFTAEDGVTVIGQVNFGGADCTPLRCTAITVGSANYDTWAADGTLDFTIAADADVDNFCESPTVQAFLTDAPFEIDDISPEITAPADITVVSTGEFTSVDLGVATATDNIDTNPAITNNSPGLFPLGDTIVTWTATDEFSNTANAFQRVTITPCTNLTNPICVRQTVILKRQQFCNTYTFNPATGGYFFTSLFGFAQEVQADDFLIDVINERCGRKLRPK